MLWLPYSIQKLRTIYITCLQLSLTIMRLGMYLLYVKMIGLVARDQFLYLLDLPFFLLFTTLEHLSLNWFYLHNSTCKFNISICNWTSRRHADIWSQPGHYQVDPYTSSWSPKGHGPGHDWPLFVQCQVALLFLTHFMGYVIYHTCWD